jgi:integrase
VYRIDRYWVNSIGRCNNSTRRSCNGYWAIQPKRAYAATTPFSYGGRVPEDLRKSKERSRDKRLQPGQEDALLAAARPHLRDCIVAALETGMRKGEILSLRWRDVRWLQNEIAIQWKNTKTRQSREIPIRPAMRELLVRRQQAHPKDQPWKPTDFVFGNEIGKRVKNIRMAWDSTVLRASGVKVVRGHSGRVSKENREHLRRIDLHFHDLRHEAGSRRIEEGWPLHDVAYWLGHSNVTTTAGYLNSTKHHLHELNERVPLKLVNK